MNAVQGWGQVLPGVLPAEGLIMEYHITGTWSSFNRNLAGNIFKHILIGKIYMSS